MTEIPFTFRCADDELAGIVSLSERPSDVPAVLIVVGGPQYRSGSHRQFTLLARDLAGRGIPAMRFDYRGMGDSQGALRTFEAIGDDIRAAIDALVERVPTVRRVVLWGLCDAASAVLFYAWRDARVAGVALLNPWVYTPEGDARTRLRHYYGRRLLSLDLWKRMLTGNADVAGSVASLWTTVTAAVAGRARTAAGPAPTDASVPDRRPPLPDRMADALGRLDVPVLLVLSGNDLVARQFTACVAASRRWQRLLASPRVTRREMPDATHTFSTRAWRDEIAAWTAEWCATLAEP